MRCPRPPLPPVTTATLPFRSISSPFSYCAFLRLRARHASFDRIGRVVEARRRWMPWHHEAVNQRLVFGGELMPERAEVVVPLRLGARAGDGGGNERVVEHPEHGELAGGHAAALGMLFDLLREIERFRAPFR